jgi:N-acetylornithine carbamoyltransferase
LTALRRFLDLADLPATRRDAVLARAGELARRPVGDALRGRVVGLLFMNPSVRTLASMQAGVAQLGGSTFVVTPGQGSWRMEHRDGVVMDGEAAEHVREAIPVLGSYADLLGVRSFAEGKNLREDLADTTIRTMAELSPVPFVNLESAISHPCQALADWKTLDDLEVPRRGGRLVLSWAYHPKALPLAVAASTLTMAAMRGMTVTVLRPEGYELPKQVMERARSLASESGGFVRETADRDAAMDGAHVLYAKSWASPALYGRPEESSLRARHRDWCVDEPWFRPSAPGARFMHCLPVRRNVKVKDAVLDGPRSAVIAQAANRLHAQKSLLIEMLEGNS